MLASEMFGLHIYKNRSALFVSANNYLSSGGVNLGAENTIFLILS